MTINILIASKIQYYTKLNSILSKLNELIFFKYIPQFVHAVLPSQSGISFPFFQLPANKVI